MSREVYRNPFEKRVTFSEQEMSAIQSIAENRQAPKDLNPELVTDKRIIQRDNVQTHVIGLMGEYAVGKLINGHLDAKSYLSGDQRQDFDVYGISIEVKTLQGYLTFKDISDFVADVAVLVIYDKRDLSTVWVQGWISQHDFKNAHFVDNFGYGDRPCVQPSELIPIGTLKAYCIMTRNLRWLQQSTLSKQ